MTPRKWKLVQLFEVSLKYFLPLLPSPHVKDGEVSPKSILVVEYWNLGDLAILVPFLRNLRSTFPETRISLLVNAGLASFLEGQGLVDEFIPVRVPWAQHFSRWKKFNPFSDQWFPFVQTLLAVRKKQFDWVFSGRMDVRDNFMLWLSGAARRIGYGFGGGGLFLTDQIEPDLYRPHRADVWLRLLEALAKPINREIEGFHLRDAEIASARTFFRERDIPDDAVLIGVHPGARIAVRRWGDDRFAEVTRQILACNNRPKQRKQGKIHILWFSEPGSATTAPPFECCHLASLDFRSFLAVLSRCHLCICNDSGPMHLANLLKVPVVAVFGPQRPEWFGPRGPKDRIVIRPELSCRPCFDYCVFDQPYCLRMITPREVFETVAGLLDELYPEGSKQPIGSSSAITEAVKV